MRKISYLKKVNSDLRIRILDYWNTNPGLPKSDRKILEISLDPSHDLLKMYFSLRTLNFKCFYDVHIAEKTAELLYGDV